MSAEGLYSAMARLAEYSERFDDMEEEVDSKEAEVARLAQQRDIAKAKLASRRTHVDKVEIAALGRRLARSTEKLDAYRVRLKIVKKRLLEKEEEIADLTRRFNRQGDIMRKTLAARDEVAKRGPKMKVGKEMVMMMMDQSNVNLMLKRHLVGERAQLNRAMFELQLQRRSSRSMKATIALLNDHVEILKRSKAVVQTPAESFPLPVDGVAKKRKGRKGSVAPGNSGKGAMSTKLSGIGESDSDSKTDNIIYGAESGGNTTGGNVRRSVCHRGIGGSGGESTGVSLSVQQVADPPVTTSPPNSETAPAVIHTWPQSKSDKQQRETRG
ncbi:unnamed protein product [Ectocarpus fasciculatus]